MAKLKHYRAFTAGGGELVRFQDTCITKAAKQFIAALPREAAFKLRDRKLASVSYKDNHTITSDFVVMEV